MAANDLERPMVANGETISDRGRPPYGCETAVSDRRRRKTDTTDGGWRIMPTEGHSAMLCADSGFVFVDFAIFCFRVYFIDGRAKQDTSYWVEYSMARKTALSVVATWQQIHS